MTALSGMASLVLLAITWNRLMDALDAILTRRTVPPAKMGPPGPDAVELRRILAAGAAAPDHGLLRPFRFLVVQDEGRARLGELFAACVRRAALDVSPQEIEKQRTAPLRAPVIVIVVAKVEQDHPKIPAIEQIAAAAAAAQNMLLAAHALGFAAKWATGRQAYDEGVKAGLGLGPADRIIGFLYLGSYAAEHRAAPRGGIEDIVQAWPPAMEG
ncbi:nitroreductase [Benzoatithermus flavus]|uniref:Putative NAD(P)H nitroreductase n=1 Tax=Benzoatithermus flavus TaxID=3108223 RepID=A0ABU8XT46_9PROT